MNRFFVLYDKVRIKATNETGVIVEIDTDRGRKPPIFFVEKDDKYKTGFFPDDCIWCHWDEIEFL